MSRARRGWIVAIVHVLLAITVAGKFLFDRQTLPRVWVRAYPYDPRRPMQGRYLQLRLEVAYSGSREYNATSNTSLAIVDEKLTALQEPAGEHYVVFSEGHWNLGQPLKLYLPNSQPWDPKAETRVEVSVPEGGLPRPIQIRQ